MSTQIKAIFNPKLITESILRDYQDMCGAIRELEKKKEDLRKSILHAFPEGGSVGAFLIFIESMNRRSFPFDDVKAQMSDKAWKTLYEPYIVVSEVRKLIVKKQTE